MPGLFKCKPFLLKKPQTGIDRLRIIEPPLIFRDLLQGLINTKGRPVGTESGHGFDDVGNGDDLGFEQDLLVFYSPGITCTVEPLMVLEDDLSQRKFKFDIF